MLKHRCPWCGEQLPIDFIGPSDPISIVMSESNNCPKCKKKHRNYGKRVFLIILIVAFLSVRPVISTIKRYQTDCKDFWIVIICALFVVFILSIIQFRLPYERLISEKENTFIKQKSTANVKFVWTPHKENGLRIPRLQVVNKEIFPACFMDENGTPVSAALCVVLEDLKWTDGHHCTGRIEFVLDDIEEEKLFRKGNQFCLYHNYHCIAKGQIQ